MHRSEEAAFEAKAEKMLRGHRELPNGRDYRAFYERFRSDVGNEEFARRFDQTFPEAPGTETRMAKDYCQGCDRLRSWCECK